MIVGRFIEWMAEAETGDVIIYMQADFAGRQPEVQRFFWEAARDGKVFLYQKRVRPGVFNYFAKRVSPRTGKKIAPWDIDN